MGERRDTLPPPEVALTKAEQEVLDFVAHENLNRGKFPSSAAIGEATGISVVRVRVVLQRLQELGYVRKVNTSENN